MSKSNSLLALSKIEKFLNYISNFCIYLFRCKGKIIEVRVGRSHNNNNNKMYIFRARIQIT